MEKTDQKKKKSPLRILLIIILVLMGLCFLTSAILFLTNQFLPKLSATPEVLSQVDLAQAGESLNLMAQLGNEVWTGLDDNMPLILWNDSYAFLINNPQKLTGWNLIEGLTVNDLPIYTQPNEVDYQAFTEKLSTGRYAGSMATKNTTNVEFINLFKQNLPPVIRQIFPYRLLLLSSDMYITSLVHESFHAYQAETFPQRFIDSEKAYSSTGAYEDIFPDMSEDWQTEVQILLDAVQETDRSKQINLIQEFLEARENRREKFGLSKNLVLYEKHYEWLEGSAKYVELGIWKIAADSNDYHPVDRIAIDKDFHAYQNYEKRWNNEQTNARNAAKNGGDSLFYYSGMLQGRLLDKLMPDWKSKMGEPGVWYEDLLRDAIN